MMKRGAYSSTVHGIPTSTFAKMNTKNDSSQNGSPVPFQAGDFASSNYESSTSKSISEILIFYVLGIGLSVIGYLTFINVPVFKDILNDTIRSFSLLAGMILISSSSTNLGEYSPKN